MYREISVMGEMRLLMLIYKRTLHLRCSFSLIQQMLFKISKQKNKSYHDSKESAHLYAVIFLSKNALRFRWFPAGL